MAFRERTHALTRAALDQVTLERLMTEGGSLRDEQIAALAFAIDESP